LTVASFFDVSSSLRHCILPIQYSLDANMNDTSRNMARHIHISIIHSSNKTSKATTTNIVLRHPSNCFSFVRCIIVIREFSRTIRVRVVVRVVTQTQMQRTTTQFCDISSHHRK